MQRNWVIWMRAVTVTAAIMAILVSALPMSPEIDDHFLPAHPAATSGADVGAINDGVARPASHTICHIGHGCMLVILPANDLALMRFDSAPGLSRVTGYLPSVAGDIPFHTPRILLQV